MTASGTVIGRSAEVHLLSRCAARARDGTHAVLLSGAAGIGKSDLARHLAREVQTRGGRVGWAVAGAWRGASPFWPWAEALAHLGVASDELLGRADAAPGGEGIAGRAEAFAMVGRSLTAAARDGPLLVVIEDLHRADPTTLELFAYLAQRPGPGAVLLLGTARPGHEAVDALRIDRIEVPPWTLADVTEAARRRRRDLDDAALAALHARTGGNPLFALRLLESPDPAAAPAPSDVQTLLSAQVAALPGSTRNALEAMAVMGSAVGTDQLAEVCGCEVANSLDRAQAVGLVHVDEGVARFDHDLIREAVYATLPPARRATLHEATAIFLTREVADPGVVAHHYARAARAGTGRTAAVLARRAGTAALRAGALPEAVRYHEQARAALRLTEDRHDELDFVLDHVRALSFARRIAEAEGALLEAEGLATSAAARRRFVREYGRLRWREEPNATVLRPTELGRIVQTWFARSDRDEDAVVRETTLVTLAEIEGITPKALAAADSALMAARRTGDDGMLAEAHLARRRALMVHHCSLHERRIDSAAALAGAHRAGDSELAGRARRHAVADAMAAGDRTQALALMNPDQRSPSSALVEHVALWRAGMAALEGRALEAETLLAEARAQLDTLGVHSLVLEYVATAYAWDTGRLAALLTRFEPILAAIADPTLRAGTALAAVIDGDHDAAQGHLDVALDTLLGPDITPLWLVGAGAAAEVAAALDDPRCEALYEVLAPYTGQCIVPAAAAAPFLGAVDRPLGLLSLRLHEADRAVAQLRSSLRTHRAMRAAPWEARSHAALAGAHGRRGETADAERHEAEATRMGRELGMGDVLLLGSFADPPPGPPPAATLPGRARLRPMGGLWEVGLDQQGGAIAPLVGLTHIARLVGDGGRDWHVLDLAGAPGGRRAGAGHGGQVLDDAARAAYRRRYEELSRSLAEADADADRAAVERARLELDQLESQLLSAYGLSGRARTMDDPTERTRINVQRAIHRAIERVASVSPPLADHLHHRIHTGRFCRYQPDPAHPVIWEL